MNKARLLLSVFLIYTGLILNAQVDKPGSVDQRNMPEIKGYPVILKGDTLFRVYSPIGPFTAEERAKAISLRLSEIIKDTDFDPDSIIFSKVDRDYYVFYKNHILMDIGPRDTVETGSTVREVAVYVVNELKNVLASHSKTFSLWRILTNIGLTLLVIIIFLVIVWLLNRFFRWIYKWIEKNKEKIFRSVRVQNYEFLTVSREYSITIYLLRILKIVLIVVSVLIAMPVIFSIFPATEGITRKIIDLIWGPFKNILLSVLNYIPKLITILVIYFIFRYLIRFIRFLAHEVERKSLVLPGFHTEWAKPTYNIIRILLYAFMFVVIFPYLPGSDSPVFRGVSVFLGVLISLGSTSLISNAMAGLVITYMRPYKIGDRIKVDDIVGDVTEKTMMITRIRTIKNEDVTIPNAKVLTGYTINYSTPVVETEGLIIYTSVSIGYSAPWRKVHDLLIKAAEATEGVSKNPRPFVLQTDLDDFYIRYQINAFTKNPKISTVIKSDLHKNIQDQFNKAGVEIMSPHYRADRDGSEITIPIGKVPDLSPEPEKNLDEGKSTKEPSSPKEE